MADPLMDKEFLRKLDTNKNRTVYAKIIALTMNEEPVEEITGRVTSGSITVDGSSSVRRSCSLSLVANELNISNYYWGLNTKIRLFIGLENTIDKRYEDIIWFKQGTFVISTLNINQTVNSFTISLQGKDKMCYLNGDLGGIINSLTWTFDTLTEITEGKQTKIKIPVAEIIRDTVHTFAGEPMHNIVINDLDDVGLELLEYRGKNPMYFLFNYETQEVQNMTLDGSQTYYEDEELQNPITLEEIGERGQYDLRMEGLVNPPIPTIIYSKENKVNNRRPSYTVAKIEYGATCGYRITDLVYAGDLTVSIGTPVTTGVLDKIKNMLSNFEYYYDIDGRFIFQRKKTYLDESWTNIVNNGKFTTYIPILLTEDNYVAGLYYTAEEQANGTTAYFLSKGPYNKNERYYMRSNGAYVEPVVETSKNVYNFEGSTLISSYQNNPNLQNLKNDFSVWGARKSPFTGAAIPIHMRYAIDKKPILYKSIGKFKKYTSIWNKDDKNTYYIRKNGVFQKYNKENGYDKNYIYYTMENPPYIYSTLSEEETKEYLSQVGIQEDEIFSSGYKKKKNPAGLSEDWWEIMDWANYYQQCTGEFPPGKIGDYCTNGGLDMKDVLPQIQFVDGINSYPGTVSGWNAFERIKIYIFDVEANGKIGYTGHGTGCNHFYEYFRSRAEQGKGTSYIYMPLLPEEIRDSAIDIIVDDTAIKPNLDWREIIYQMAVDYNLYNKNEETADDFVYMVKTNNKLLYPTGYTGYERYYTDIYGFWRDLYDPDFKDTFDLEPDPKNSTYYIVDNGETSYSAIDFRDCVNIKDVRTEESNGSGPFFYKNGEIYERYITYQTIESSVYRYRRDKQKLSLENFDPAIKYFTKNGDEFQPIEPINGKLTLPVNTDIYIYKGYNKVIQLDQGKTYYTRSSEAFSPLSDNILQLVANKNIVFEILAIPGTTPSWAKVKTLTRGQTYRYTDGSVVGQITYPSDAVYYEAIGDRGYLKVIDGDEGKHNWLCFESQSNPYTYINRFELGKIYDIYKTNIIETNYENGYYYRLPASMIAGESYTIDYIRFLDKFIDTESYYVNKNGYLLFNIYSFKDNDKKHYPSDKYLLDGFWNKDVILDPSVLNFWFDFLDTDGDINKYSVPVVGDRAKAVNNDDIKSIYYRKTPNVVFVDADKWEQDRDKKSGYTYIKLQPSMTDMFTLSAQGKTAQDELDSFLYNFAYCTEQISITTVPIYYLEPNTRIYVRDDNSGINGEYIITRLTIPLVYNGMMNITAVKAAEKLF